MALAKKCDICGKLYELYNAKDDSKNPSGIMFVNVDRTGRCFSHKAMDCCPECMESIKKHIEGLEGDKQ